ncbi:MAG TPA: hypothetical protein VJ825_11795 [Gemmatimonadaceae bacterium]|nr:hypothetical protein [Gemmatimonadaceae bacterium]
MESAEPRIVRDHISRAEPRSLVAALVEAPTAELSAPTAMSASAAERWHQLPIVHQLAHIGSEVERAIRAHEAGKQSRFDAALTRALELFDLTAGDRRWNLARRREVLRAREEFCRLFFSDDVPAGSAEGLSRYFLAFATVARTAAAQRS